MKTNKKNITPNKRPLRSSTPFFRKAEVHKVDSQKPKNPFFSRTIIQPKLSIGQPNDVYEQEADRMADRVVKRKNEAIISYPDSTYSESVPLKAKKTNVVKQQAVPRRQTRIKPDISLNQEKESDENLPELQMQISASALFDDVSPPDIQGSSDSEGGSSNNDNLGARLKRNAGRGNSLTKDTCSEMEAAFGTNFHNIRIHTDSEAISMSKDLGAQAFTHSSDIYFNKGKYNSSSIEGKHLLAHELTHTVQQESRNKKDETKPISQVRNTLIQKQDLEESSGSGSSMNFSELVVRDVIDFDRLLVIEPAFAREIQRISAQVEFFMGNLDEQIRRVRVQATPRQARAIQAFIAFERRINSQSDLSPANLYLWTLKLEFVMRVLGRVIDVFGNQEGESANAEAFENERLGLIRSLNQLKETPYLIQGRQDREQIEENERNETKIVDTIEEVRTFMRRHWRAEQSNLVKTMHATVLANKMVHDNQLNAEQIREVLRRIRIENEDFFNAMMYEGRTIHELLERGIGGLQEFRGTGEGFASGLIRGEQESLLADEPGQRSFDAGETLIAAGGFITGILQGIGDSLISNVKAIVDLFTPSFWQGLYGFFTEFIPNYIDNEEFRFEIGQLLGQASAAEIRRLATASPFEFGRTIGQFFGFALTELVLSIIGLGWVLKAIRGMPMLSRISVRLVEVAERVSKFAIVARGISIAQSIAEGIAAIRRRLRALFNRLPALTPTGRFRRAVAELDETERAIQNLAENIDNLERQIRRANASGQEDEAASLMNQFDDKTDEMERLIDNFENGSGRTAESVDDMADANRIPPDQQNTGRIVANADNGVNIGGERHGLSIKRNENGQFIIQVCSDCDGILAIIRDAVSDPEIAANPELMNDLRRIGDDALEVQEALTQGRIAEDAADSIVEDLSRRIEGLAEGSDHPLSRIIDEVDPRLGRTLSEEQARAIIGGVDDMSPIQIDEMLRRNQDDPVLRSLLRRRGTLIHSGFTRDVVPALRRSLPPNTLFIPTDSRPLRQALGLHELPWRSGTGPDIILVDLRSSPRRIAVLDLTSRPNSSHLAGKQSQANQLLERLSTSGQNDWALITVEDFYHRYRNMDIDRTLDQVGDVLRSFGFTG